MNGTNTIATRAMAAITRIATGMVKNDAVACTSPSKRKSHSLHAWFETLREQTLFLYELAASSMSGQSALTPSVIPVRVVAVAPRQSDWLDRRDAERRRTGHRPLSSS